MTLRLVLTCRCSPEQYDVYDGVEEIGYLRLRHGHFRAEYRGEVVYETSDILGDGWFDSDAERTEQLTAAVIAILNKHNPLFVIEDTLEPVE